MLLLESFRNLYCYIIWQTFNTAFFSYWSLYDQFGVVFFRLTKIAKQNKVVIIERKEPVKTKALSKNLFDTRNLRIPVVKLVHL